MTENKNLSTTCPAALQDSVAPIGSNPWQIPEIRVRKKSPPTSTLCHLSPMGPIRPIPLQHWMLGVDIPLSAFEISAFPPASPFPHVRSLDAKPNGAAAPA